MTQEDKELLIKDISARLPYGIKSHYTVNKYLMEIIGINIHSGTVDIIELGKHRFSAVPIEEIKPYLRPMSSMTDEEGLIAEEMGCDTTLDEWEMANYLDWLNAHHFDFRGLIERGLALEAPKDMYN